VPGPDGPGIFSVTALASCCYQDFGVSKPLYGTPR